MKANFNTIGLNHPSFDHLSTHERNEINMDLLSGRAMIVEFTDEKTNEFIAACVYKADGYSLHVQELSGRFVRNIKPIEFFSNALARALNLHYLTYTARRKGTERIGAALGFVRDPDGYFVKAV